MPQTEIDAARSILSSCPVEECRVLTRHSAGTALLVAYFVANGSPVTDDLAHAFRAAFPDAPQPDLWVPLTAMPLTPSGDVDDDALLAVGVLDPATLAAAEQQLRESIVGSRAVLIVEEDAVPPPPLHLGDVLPGWKRGRSAAAEGAAMAPAPVPGSSAARIPASRTGDALTNSVPENLPAALLRAASEFGIQGIVCIQDNEDEVFLSYSDLLQDAEKILRSLRGLGAQPQDRFIFQFPQNQDFIPAFWACILGGFVPVPISIAPTYDQPNATISKLQNAWQMLGKPWILTSEALKPSVDALASRFEFEGLRTAAVEQLRQAERDGEWHPCRPDDLALLLFTSGSTGKPKAVRQCHRSLLRRSAAAAQMSDFSSAEISLNWMPLDHVGGIVMFHLMDVYLGARQIHAPTQLILQAPLKWLDLVERHRVTTTWAPNFAFGLVNAEAETIAKRQWDLSTLRFILNAGEAIVPRTARRFMELLTPHRLPFTAMRPAWGMSETCSAVTYSTSFTLDQTSDRDSFVRVGGPVPEFSMRIVDAEGNVVNEGSIGRLHVKGPSVTSGYDRNPDANRESFTGDGWFVTGDLGIIEDGSLTITGRQKDVIIVNGVNFYSHELEAVVEEVANVEISFTAVCPVREPEADTDSIAVFFCPSSKGTSAGLAGLIRDIRGRLVQNAGVNPTYFVPLEKHRIPKTEIGKIQRAQLRQRLLDGEFNDLLKKVDVLTESANTVPDWFFEKAWQRRNTSDSSESTGPGGGTVVFCGSSEAARKLIPQLREQGLPAVEIVTGSAFSRLSPDCFELDPAEPEHYISLFRSLAEERFAVARVLHLNTFGASEPSAPQSIAMPLLHMVKALLAETGDETVSVDVVSSGAQAVVPEDGDASANAALPPLLRSISAEEPRLSCRHIDLTPGDATSDATLLLNELRGSGSDSEVAYREKIRYVSRLRKCVFDNREEPQAGFVTGGLYLLSGGLGGIGTEMARFLLTQYGARVLLIGRKPASPHSLDSLQPLGEVRYAAVDVRDFAALQKTVAEAEQAWGRSLDGILHLAAVYRDGTIARENTAHLTEVFEAKVRGAATLERLLDERPDAFLVNFSSVLSFFPGAMVGPYSGANRMVENLALRGRARGLKTFAIAWGGWRETGMSQGHASGDALRARGIRDMSAEQGWNSLRLALAYGSPVTFVGLDASNASVRKVCSDVPCAKQRASVFAASDAAAEAGARRDFRFADRFGVSCTASFQTVQELPLTPAGDVDRAELLAMVGRLRRGAARRVAPATETERQVCAVWQQVLSAPELGVEDNFFIFGGHSLLATRVMSRLRGIFNVDIPLRSLFDAPTVRRLSLVVEKLRQTRGEEIDTIRSLADRTRLPLSFTQQRLWFLDQMLPGSPVYNVPLLFRARGGVNIDILGRTLSALVARHESLRTTFPLDGGEPIQRIDDPRAVAVQLFDLREYTSDGEQRARQIATEEARRPFDLAQDLMLRACAIQIHEDELFILFTLHHIVADGWSLSILLREINSFYRAFSAGNTPVADDLPVHFADYAAWQRRKLQGIAFEEETSYWKRQLEGAAPQLKLPADLPRPVRQTFRGALRSVSFAPDLGLALTELCRSQNVTPFIALLTAFQVLLRQYSGQDDISFGSPIANRTTLETEGLIGFFANTLVLRTVFPPEPSFREMLGRVREVALGAYAHQHMPFEKLVELLKPPRNPGFNPLFQVNFRVVTEPTPQLSLDGVDLERVPLDPGIARFDLALELLHTPDRFEGYFEYSTDLFYPETIQSIQADFETVLRTLLLRIDEPLSSLGFEKLALAPPGRRQGVIRRRPAKRSEAPA